MIVKVMMTRRVPKLTGGMDVTLLPHLSEMLIELRNMANRQAGYISGETLRNVDDPNEYLVISTWKSLEAWERWFENQERAELEGRVDALLGIPTIYKVFSYS